MSYFLSIILSIALIFNRNPIEQNIVEGYFEEVAGWTARSSPFWGLDLNGPIIIVNASTQTIYANQGDADGVLTSTGQFFSGALPSELTAAVGVTTWQHKKWIVVPIERISRNPFERRELLAHELFHLHQAELNIEPGKYTNTNCHLETIKGRIYLRLEIEGLKKALASHFQSQQLLHIRNALAFRKKRYQIFTKAKTSENDLELKEGLANYTGLALSDRDHLAVRQCMHERLTKLVVLPSYSRAFAHELIPVYGLLLAQYDDHWHRAITQETDLLSFFASKFNLELNTAGTSEGNYFSKNTAGE